MKQIQTDSGRQEWIDACKGIGIILVVLGHITHGYLAAGIFSDYYDVMKAIDSCIYSFHMTFFFMISGITFQLAYFRRLDERFLSYKKQIVNLVWIFTVFSIVQWVFMMAFSGMTNNHYSVVDLLLFWLKPMSPYWYLWVLIIYYVLFGLAARFKIIFNILLIGSAIIGIIGSFIGTSFNAVPKNLLFFIFPFTFGMLFMAKNMHQQFNKILKLILVILSATAFAAIIWFRNDLQGIPVLSIVCAFILSLSCIFVVKKLFGRCKLFVYLGQRSLEIYVMHCFITAPCRKILLYFNITNFWCNILLNLLLAITLPLAARYIMKKLKIYGFVFKAGAILKK